MIRFNENHVDECVLCSRDFGDTEVCIEDNFQCKLVPYIPLLLYVLHIISAVRIFEISN